MSNEKLVCPICGEPTSVYMGNARKDRLCRKHAFDLKAGKIEQCPDCKKWNTTEELCTCKNQKETKEEIIEELPKVVTIDSTTKSKCITCGKSTDGLLFCGSCYRRYKDKELLFRITKCSNVELLDESYEGIYTCKDGHIVKSKSEREIDNYLYENNIPHAYERELPYGATEKEVLHPDFYLPHYLGHKKHVYIEHWGYNENNLHYTKSKAFKMPIYKKLGITLICTYEKTDIGKIDTVLDRKLLRENIKENEINFEE